MTPDARILFAIPALLLVPVIAVLMAAPGALYLIVDLRAAAKDLGSATVFIARRILAGIILLGYLLNLYILCLLGREYHWGAWAYLVPIPIAIWGAVRFLRIPQRIALDENGVTSKPFAGTAAQIAWSDLSHIEVQSGFLRDFGSGSRCILHTFGGAKVTIPGIYFDCEEVVRKMREHRSFPKLQT